MMNKLNLKLTIMTVFIALMLTASVASTIKPVKSQGPVDDIVNELNEKIYSGQSSSAAPSQGGEQQYQGSNPTDDIINDLNKKIYPDQSVPLGQSQSPQAQQQQPSTGEIISLPAKRDKTGNCIIDQGWPMGCINRPADREHTLNCVDLNDAKIPDDALAVYGEFVILCCPADYHVESELTADGVSTRTKCVENPPLLAENTPAPGTTWYRTPDCNSGRIARC